MSTDSKRRREHVYATEHDIADHTGMKGSVMKTRFVIAATAGFALSLTTSRAEAQPSIGRYEVGAQLTTLQQNDFRSGDNRTDYGIAGRLSYDLTGHVAVEGDLSWFPQNLGASPAFSRYRLGGFFGVKVGTRGPGASVFGIVKPGFVRFGPGPEPIFCIQIFPTPLNCALASGQNEFAVAIGGGVAAPLSGRLHGRLDVTDAMIRFDQTTIRDGRLVNKFVSHHLQVNAGLGWRF